MSRQIDPKLQMQPRSSQVAALVDLPGIQNSETESTMPVPGNRFQEREEVGTLPASVTEAQS